MKLSREQLYHQLHMTYLRCLSCCYYCPDIWIAFAQFEASYDWKRAVDVLKVAREAIPTSVILQLACCDFYEEHDQIESAQSCYETILTQFKDPIVWIKYMQFTRRQRGLQAYREQFLRAKAACSDPEIYIAAGEIGSVRS